MLCHSAKLDANSWFEIIATSLWLFHLTLRWGQMSLLNQSVSLKMQRGIGKRNCQGRWVGFYFYFLGQLTSNWCCWCGTWLFVLLQLAKLVEGWEGVMIYFGFRTFQLTFWPLAFHLYVLSETKTNTEL